MVRGQRQMKSWKDSQDDAPWVPPPPVFFVRVANKELMLDAASTFDDAGFEVIVFSVGCAVESLTARCRLSKNKRRFGREREVTSCETLGFARGAIHSDFS